MKLHASTCQSYPFEDREFYAGYLAQTYFFVRHSTRLLAAALVRLDEGYAPIAARFRNHLFEEQGHEMLALRDIERLGRSINQMEELSETKALYECQYYKIEHQHPLALLGYIIFLEGLATTAAPAVLARVQKIFESSCSFLKIHCEDDVAHVEMAIRITEDMPSAVAELAKANYSQTADLFFHMFNAIRSKSRA